MNLSGRLSAFFNVRPGEGRLVTLLTIHYFFLGAASVFTQTTSFALFLNEFGAQGLPFAYMSIAVGASLAALLYLKLGERLPLSKLVVANLVSLAIINVAFRLGLLLPHARVFLFLLPLWFQIFANFTILAIWSLAGRLLDVRQGKRLFGLIGAGNWLAVAIGGFVVSPIVTALGTPNLLVLAAISLIIGVVFQLAILREFGAPANVMPQPRRPAQTRKTSASLLSSRYVLLFLALVVVWWVGFFFIDNIFYDRAAIQFPDPNLLAGSLGNLFAVSGVIGLITTTFFTGPVLNRYGLRVGLFILPFILTLSIAGLAVGGTLGLIAAGLFMLAALAKITNLSFGFTIDLTAHNLLYQPLPADRRASVQTLADGIVQPLAIGLAGLLLLLFNTILGFRAVQLSYLFLVIAAIWITVVAAIQREYPAALSRALEKRRLDGSTAPVIDQTYAAALRQSLASPQPAAVIYALHLLRDTYPEALPPELPGLLGHPSSEVRYAALDQVEQLALASVLPAVRRRVSEEPLPHVRGRALQALAAMGGSQTIDEVLPYLDDPDAELRRGAIVGLLRSSGTGGAISAGQKLQGMAASPSPSERALAAQVLGEAAIQHFYQPLLSLLADADLAVRRSALRSAGRIRHPVLWPLVIQGLGSPHTRAAAVAALAAGGESALPAIRLAFEQPEADTSMCAALAHAAGRIGGEGSAALLKDCIDDPDPHLRSEVLRALTRCSYRAHASDAARIRMQIQLELQRAAWLLACALDVGEDGTPGLLQNTLSEELAGCRERILLLLSFIYDSRAMLQARDALEHSAPEQRAYALEILEVTLPDELKRPVLGLLTDLSPEARFQRLNVLYPQPRLSREARLAGLSDGQDERVTTWMRACARYAQGASTIIRDGDEDMFSTIEKAIALKTTGIFAGMPERVLAEVADLCEEMQVSAGETIFHKDELGKCLYVIVSGRVQVHDEQQTLEYLTDGQVFGEMALLDPEPRSASITAAEDTRLLRLDQEPFFELLEEQGEIARGVITMLTRRLRARMHDLTELRSQIEGGKA